MICELCKKREANKKNTHYLTDSIIRTCLNQDGSNERETGFYFDISNNTPFVDFNFQRGTSVTKLEESLGRPATDEEIEKARDIPFSVDYVFCSLCEAIFTMIETSFVDRYLYDFRENDLTGTNNLEFEDFKSFKMFFYLQVWRNAICEETFQLNENVKENLRLAILNYGTISDEDLPNYPLHITYLQTTGDAKAYTGNCVGCTNDRNPNIIFLNDFVVQFFDDIENVKSIDFYGLNDSNDIEQLINVDNSIFRIKVLPNHERLDMITRIAREEKVQKVTIYFIKTFSKQWFLIFGGIPHLDIIQEYINYITEGGFDILQYTEETIIEKTTGFIESKIK